MDKENETELEIIGSTEYIEVADIKDIPAKIDTGADSSAIWASNISMDQDGILSFTLFDEISPFYTGERLHSSEYAARVIRSSHGDEQIRYRVPLSIKIGQKSFTTNFTLANRSRNSFPVLIGRHTLSGHYLVDVSKSVVERRRSPKSSSLNQELKENPYAFHQKYHYND